MFPQLRRNPASILFIGIAGGLSLAPFLDARLFASVALILSACIASRLPRTSRRLTSLLLFSLAVGISVADRDERESARNLELVRSSAHDRFVRVTAPVDTEWIPSRDGMRLRVQKFELESDDETALVKEPLSIYAPPDVRPIGENDRIDVEGFLRVSRNGRFYVSVKSARLIRLEKARPGWHPYQWNRSIRGKLDRHVAVFPEHERAAALIRAVA
ncbi:MAG: hypothetical protein R3338_04775, partial [Thermoanaerobaculia bacterium]|nr:hypothetical protein [Thermoanaerobaculia bacterium]